MSTPRRAMVLALGLGAAACLPKDTRPEPGSLTVTVTSALPNEQAVWTSSDGWVIAYQRLLVSARRASLDGDGCNEYSDARYGRLYDAVRAGSNKLSQLYSLGHCDFGFRVENPRSDDLLGPGVTKDDQVFMRTPGSDDWSTNRGVSVHVEGTATKAAVTKHFVWTFRRGIQYDSCKLVASGATESGVTLAGGDDRRLDITIHGESLFMDDLDPEKASLRFDVFALADDQYGNADGEITLDELALVPLGSAPVEPGDAGPANTDSGRWESLADYVYLGLVRRIARFRDSGQCDVSESG